MSKMSMLAIVVAVAAAATAGEAQKKGRDTNAVAEKLVSQTLPVKEGDIVLVSGTAADADLLEDLAVHIRKRGAHPILVLDPSNRVAKRFWTEVPAKYDSQTPE